MLGLAQVAGDDLGELVAIPVRLEQIEVRRLSKPCRACVARPPGHVHPCLRHGHTRWPVVVEDVPPLGVDLVHFVAVLERVGGRGPASRGWPRPAADQRDALPAGERRRRGSRRPRGRPRSAASARIVADISVVRVEVRLLASMNVQIPLAVSDRRPHRAPEPGLPVRRRLRTIGPRAVAEDVTIARPRAAPSRQRLTKPRVSVRGVVGNDVHDKPHSRGGEHTEQLIEVSSVPSLASTSR